MELKTVEEYSQEMTRREFDRFTYDEELCPSDFGLKGFYETEENDCAPGNCKECFDKALIGLEFKVGVPALPKETMPILRELQQLEITAKAIAKKQTELKVALLDAMEKNNIKKWENDVIAITYSPPTTRNQLDSKKLKNDHPDIFEKYVKTSSVKSSVRITLKEKI